MENVNETLDPKNGWSSGKRTPQRGKKTPNINDGVLMWIPGVTNVAVREYNGAFWLFRLMPLGFPYGTPTWQPCRYEGQIPAFGSPEEFIEWASSRRYQGLNILD